MAQSKRTETSSLDTEVPGGTNDYPTPARDFFDQRDNTPGFQETAVSGHAQRPLLEFATRSLSGTFDEVLCRVTDAGVAFHGFDDGRVTGGTVWLPEIYAIPDLETVPGEAVVDATAMRDVVGFGSTDSVHIEIGVDAGTGSEPGFRAGPPSDTDQLAESFPVEASIPDLQNPSASSVTSHLVPIEAMPGFDAFATGIDGRTLSDYFSAPNWTDIDAYENERRGSDERPAVIISAFKPLHVRSGGALVFESVLDDHETLVVATDDVFVDERDATVDELAVDESGPNPEKSEDWFPYFGSERTKRYHRECELLGQTAISLGKGKQLFGDLRVGDVRNRTYSVGFASCGPLRIKTEFARNGFARWWVAPRTAVP